MLNQLSKKNDSTPHNKISNTKPITDSKSTESANKTKNSNTERVQHGSKNMTLIDPKQSTPLHKNAHNASTKENADNSEDNS